MNFKVNESATKLRGGYYTPLDLAVYISRWATEKSPETILEPSCGDGVFVEALAKVKSKSKLCFTGFELLEEEAAKSRKRCLGLPHFEAKIYNQDFLDFAISRMLKGRADFDCVVGNPPFIRYQYLPEESQRKAEAVFKILHLPFTKHTNAWVPFVLASVAMLKPGGRLALVSLSPGVTTLGRLFAAGHTLLYRFHPEWFLGCRPIVLTAYLGAGGFALRERHHYFRWHPSEVLLAERPYPPVVRRQTARPFLLQ